MSAPTKPYVVFAFGTGRPLPVTFVCECDTMDEALSVAESEQSRRHRICHAYRRIEGSHIPARPSTPPYPMRRIAPRPPTRTIVCPGCAYPTPAEDPECHACGELHALMS